MKPAPFEYYRASSAADAASKLSELGDDAKVLAGGQSLIPLLSLRLTRFDHLVDIKRAPDLAELDVTDSEVRVGATTTQTEIVRSEEVAAALPLLRLASSRVGHFQIRNRGTACGSIAHSDPAAEYPAVASALDAKIELLSVRGPRTVDAADFFVSTFENAAAPDELVQAATFPRWAPGSGFAVEEGSRRSGDFAIAGAVAAIELDGDGRVARSAISLFGVGPTPFRAKVIEGELVGRGRSEFTASSLKEIGQMVGTEIEPPSDVHASANYRKHLAGVMASRAVAKALEAAAPVGGR